MRSNDLPVSAGHGPFPSIDVLMRQRLTMALVLSLACIGLASGLSVLHANILTVKTAGFLFAQALVMISVILVLVQLWEYALATQKWIARLSAVLLLVFWVVCAARMTSSAFSHHDEIYSWNLWAIQHFQRKPYDLYYTQASYPQMYAYWLASIYGAQGDFLSQWAARLGSALPMLLLIASAIALWIKSVTTRQAALAGLVSIWMLWRTRNDLMLGYADPLMSAALAVSLVCLLAFLSSGQARWWYMCVGAACLAALTKQPAVLWACGSLPAIALIGWRWHRWPLRTLVAALCGALAVAWVTFIVSSDITTNHGVVARAFGDRGIWGTVLYSSYQYLVKRPDILVVLVASWWVVRRTPMLHVTWWLALTPMIGLWFTLGSYETRQGIHVIWMSGLLLLAGLNIRRVESGRTSLKATWKVSTPARFAAGVTLIALTALTIGWGNRSGVEWQDGQKTAFVTQMAEPAAASLYQSWLDRQSRVFTTSNYSWGLLYGRMPTQRIEPGLEIKDAESLRHWLIGADTNYAISSGDYANGPSVQLLELATACPDGLKPVLRSHDGRYTVFHASRDELKICKA